MLITTLRKIICILKYILKNFYFFKIYFKKTDDFKIYFDLQIFSKYILNLFFSVYLVFENYDPRL